MYYIANKITYFVMHKHRKIVGDRIVFESFEGKQISDSPLAIYRELINRNISLEVIWVVESFRNVDDFSKLNLNCRFVVKNSNEYFRVLSTAKVLVINNRLPYGYTKKDKQFVLQCWHGTPYKKIGCDIGYDSHPNTSLFATKIAYKNTGLNLDLFLSTGPYASACFTSAFKLSTDKIWEIGYPRNDVLLNKMNNEVVINHIKDRLGLPKDKRIILYTPTYREADSVDNKYVVSNPLLDSALSHELKDQFVFLFRGHYFSEPTSFKNNFIDVSTHNDLNELYLIADVLITDYSSTFFDFLLLQKPIIFYQYDRECYMNEVRGVYLLDSELPGSVVTDHHDLESKLMSIKVDGVYDYEDAIGLYSPLDKGLATIKTVDLISDYFSGSLDYV